MQLYVKKQTTQLKNGQNKNGQKIYIDISPNKDI